MSESRRIVFKIGSSSVSGSSVKQSINLSVLTGLVDLICELVQAGHQVILVSSGAVSVGCQRLGLSTRPQSLIAKQAVAAVGQCRLMRIYDDLFNLSNGQPIAQVLLSRENLHQKHHYTNAYNTFIELLTQKIVPIVNENDTVAVEELRFGDNDTLSALVASLIAADYLFLLTDVDALYTSNPQTNPDAKPIRIVDDIDAVDNTVSTTIPPSSSQSSQSTTPPVVQSGQWGTGGMITKLQAARVASSAGCETFIVHCARPQDVRAILAGSTDVGTRFTATKRPIRQGHKRWIAHGQTPLGSIVVNAGASEAIISHKSLFAAGVVDVIGEFQAQATVKIVTQQSDNQADSKEIARAIVNYSSAEIVSIKGKKSSEFSSILGYTGPGEIAHRDAIAITHSTDSRNRSSSG